MHPFGPLTSQLLRLLPLLHTAISGAAFVAWSAALLLVWRHRPSYPRLSAVQSGIGSNELLPTLSIIVPACNEAATVERAMRSLLALDYPHLQIIAVDDRSIDQTGEILDCLAASSGRLEVIHITALPEGWLGKNHALHVGSAIATGDWLLFTDADVVYHPQSLRRAVTYAETSSTDHLVAIPRCLGADFWERLFMSYFSLMFLFRVRPWEVARPGSPAYFGFGAFNLVRTDAYRRAGGHAALPMEVADDTKLGKILKRSGFVTRIVDASDYIELRWVVGLNGVLNGFTKNAFASFEFSLPRTMLGLGGILVTGVYPLVALAAPVGPARWLAAATVVAMVCGAFLIRRVADAEATYGLAYPLAALIIVVIIVRSTWVTLRQHGIVWRGTTYPLDDLRRGVV